MSETTKNIFLIFATVVITLGLLALGAFAFWYYQQKMVKTLPLASPLVSPIPEVTSSPLVKPNESLIPTPKPSPSLEGKSDLEQLKEAFSVKYSHPVSEVKLTISKQEGKYASGGVSFEGEMGGGWWLAYKKDSGWIIVDDGNGTVSCEKTDPYNFPVSMVPECFQESTGKLITR